MAIQRVSERDQLEKFVEDQRAQIRGLLADVDEVDARASLVPSLTTLLGLVKHAAFVERRWFRMIIAGQTYEEAGIPRTVDESFTLDPHDSKATISADFDLACAQSRAIAERTDLDATFAHPRTGEVSLRWIYLHLIREYARHAGHGDILREQLRIPRR